MAEEQKPKAGRYEVNGVVRDLDAHSVAQYENAGHKLVPVGQQAPTAAQAPPPPPPQGGKQQGGPKLDDKG